MPGVADGPLRRVSNHALASTMRRTSGSSRGSKRGSTSGADDAAGLAVDTSAHGSRKSSFGHGSSALSPTIEGAPVLCSRVLFLAVLTVVVCRRGVPTTTPSGQQVRDSLSHDQWSGLFMSCLQAYRYKHTCRRSAAQRYSKPICRLNAAIRSSSFRCNHGTRPQCYSTTSCRQWCPTNSTLISAALSFCCAWRRAFLSR